MADYVKTKNIYSVLQPKAYTRGELETVHKKATALLAHYYGTVRESRKAEQRRETLLARLDTDSDLCTCKYL